MKKFIILLSIILFNFPNDGLSQNLEHLTFGENYGFSEIYFDGFEHKNLIKYYTNVGKFSGLWFNGYKRLSPFKAAQRHIVDADITSHFFFLDEKDPFSRFLVDINPQFKVRQHFGDIQFSAPVRTPSYMPGFKIYYLFPSPFEKNYNRNENLYFGIYHHSNGQDGETLAVNAEIPDKVIFENKKLDFDFLQERLFNVYNGSFSTNFLQFGFNRYWWKTRKKEIEVIRTISDPFDINGSSDSTYLDKDYITKSINYHQLNLELRYHFFTADELEKYFSNRNIMMKYSLINVRPFYVKDPYGELPDVKLMERMRFDLNVQFRTGTIELNNFELYRAFDISSTFSFRLWRSSFLAVFLEAGYFGSDNYNIYLEDEYIFFRFGLASGSFINSNSLLSTLKR